MTDYLFAGTLSVDYIVTSDGKFHEGLLGGGMAYAAGGARIWSDSVAMMGRIGEPFPDHLLRRCRRNGIEVNHIGRTGEQVAPEIFFAYEDPGIRLDGKPAAWYARSDRRLPKELIRLQRPEAFPASVRPGLRLEDIPADAELCRAVHLASPGWKEASLLSTRLKAMRVPLVSLDPSTEMMGSSDAEHLRLVLHDVDVFLPSLRQALDFFRPARPQLEEMAETLASMGPSLVVIKRGERGQHLFDRERGRHLRIPAYPVEVADVTGAGHAFCGGFVVGLADTDDPVEGCLRGGVSASMGIEGTGPFYPLGALTGLADARLSALRGSLGQG